MHPLQYHQNHPMISQHLPYLDDERYLLSLSNIESIDLSSFSTILHSLLEVADHYKYSMYSTILGEITGVGTFVAYLKINPYARKSIVWVEVIDTVLEFLWLIGDILIVKHMKWFNGFSKGTLWNMEPKFLL